MKLFAFIAILVFPVLFQPAAAQETVEAPPLSKLVVATRQVPPFCMKDAKGQWHGLSIDLLQEVVSEINQNRQTPIEIEFRELSLSQMLAAVESGEVDIAAAALTVNLERESKMDFTHPFHTSGLGIAILADRRSGWWSVVERVFSLTFLSIVAGLFALLLISALLVYLVERRHNREHFGGGFWKGLGAGMWWSIVTLTTVGYGDKAPRTLVGRSLAVAWMLSGILIISSFTASVTSTLTVGQLRSRISGAEDLYRQRVATVSDSTSQRYLKVRSLRHRAFDDLDQALTALQAGDFDCVVYDAPILRFTVLENWPELQVLPVTFERQDYALALPQGSPLRESVSRAVLRVIGTRAWEEKLVGYLGKP